MSWWVAAYILLGLFWSEVVHRVNTRLFRQRGRPYRRPASTYALTIILWPLIVVMALIAIGTRGAKR